MAVREMPTCERFMRESDRILNRRQVTAMFAVAPLCGCTFAMIGAEQLFRAIDRFCSTTWRTRNRHSSACPDTLRRTVREH